MTRKDYRLIAGVMASQKPRVSPEYATSLWLWEDIVGRFIIALGYDNPRFQVGKFQAACNGDE